MASLDVSLRRVESAITGTIAVDENRGAKLEDRINNSSLWKPSTKMASVDPALQTIVSGSGTSITTDTGATYFDGSAALWYANLGHGHPEIAQAAYDQMSTLETYQTWGSFSNDRAVELADKLTKSDIAPIPNAKVLFGSGGSDADEIAFKLARLHWRNKGRPEKKVILSRTNAYHGLHAFGSSLRGNEDLRTLYGETPLVPETVMVSHDDIDAVRAQVDEIGAESIAAIVAEPIIGSGGVIPPKPGYLEGLRRICDEFDILLIFDEVISGFGRAGHWFASHRYGVVPDITTFAKGVTCGYFPLGGLFVAEKIWTDFYDPSKEQIFNFGVTYSGHATGCAVALKVIEIIERDGLLDRVQELESVLDAALQENIAGAPGVSEYRNVGFLAMIDFAPGIDAIEFSLELREKHGVLARPIGTGSVAISPPFISSDEEVRHLVSSIGSLLRSRAAEGSSTSE